MSKHAECIICNTKYVYMCEYHPVLTLPFSTSLVSMTMTGAWCSHTICQKSASVSGVGPGEVHTYSEREETLYPPLYVCTCSERYTLPTSLCMYM